MEFIMSHFGYIVGTFAMGAATGWITYPLYRKYIRPLFEKAKK